MNAVRRRKRRHARISGLKFISASPRQWLQHGHSRAGGAGVDRAGELRGGGSLGRATHGLSIGQVLAAKDEIEELTPRPDVSQVGAVVSSEPARGVG